MNAMGFGVGLIPEQVWERPDLARSPFGADPTTASIGFTNGEAAGSAAALTWSAGQFVRLMLDVSAGSVLDRPSYTRDRYVRHTQGETPLTVTTPADNVLVGDSVAVAGTSKPGNRIVVGAVNIDADTATSTLVTATADTGGAFSVTVPVTGGTEVLNVVATDPATGATGREVRTVVSNAPIGTLLFETTDPTGDDHGPGNYAPPTAADFHDGAWDMDQFQVFEVPGDRIAFRVRNRDQSPTFGSALGAQLVDVYVRVPGLTPTSTDASFPQRRYRIADSGAWNRLIEVQGFGQRFIDPGGTVLGTVNIRASAISRYITFSLPKAALGGTPGQGWAFTVVETGQDGFSPDQARSFAPTPQPFNFGVCATASLDPHCTFAPGLVPKAVDVLTPAGTSQADELDYTLHDPVVIAPVSIP